MRGNDTPHGEEVFRDTEKSDSNITGTYHLDKYIVPGAAAISLLFLIPYYAFGKSGLGLNDFGAVAIIALVVGHFLESLKVYEWGSKVRANDKEMNNRLDGILMVWGIKDDEVQIKRKRAKAILFALMNGSDQSEFAWNLVRWEKMITLAVLCILAGLEWMVFAALSYCEIYYVNPFAIDFSLHMFKSSVPAHWSPVVEALIGCTILLMGNYVYKNGLGRQRRTNESFLHFFIKYDSELIKALEETDRVLKKRT